LDHLLHGKNVNLDIVERADLPILRSWVNDVDFVGEFEPIAQETLGDLEKQYDNLAGGQWYFVEKKDGTKVGYIAHFKSKGCVAIGYMLIPKERRKGYGSEAVQLIVDYLFLSREIVRIQAETHPDNIASQKVLEKSGFTREGLIRKSFFSRGRYRDTAMWSILREEWKEPKILPLGHVSR
jgi:[ribosomal protein S5]-alanine N-acetyltransferase